MSTKRIIRTEQHLQDVLHRLQSERGSMAVQLRYAREAGNAAGALELDRLLRVQRVRWTLWTTFGGDVSQRDLESLHAAVAELLP